MIALRCETCGARAVWRSATSYACKRDECGGPESACGPGQTWDSIPFPIRETCYDGCDKPSDPTCGNGRCVECCGAGCSGCADGKPVRS